MTGARKDEVRGVDRLNGVLEVPAGRGLTGFGSGFLTTILGVAVMADLAWADVCNYFILRSLY